MNLRLQRLPWALAVDIAANGHRLSINNPDGDTSSFAQHFFGNTRYEGTSAPAFRDGQRKRRRSDPCAALGSAYGQPDLILIPEVPLDLEVLLQRVRTVYELQKHAVIVVGEAIIDAEGKRLGSALSSTNPAGNVAFSGAAEALKHLLVCGLGDDYFRSTAHSSLNRQSLRGKWGIPNGADGRFCLTAFTERSWVDGRSTSCGRVAISRCPPCSRILPKDFTLALF